MQPNLTDYCPSYAGALECPFGGSSNESVELGVDRRRNARIRRHRLCRYAVVEIAQSTARSVIGR